VRGCRNGEVGEVVFSLRIAGKFYINLLLRLSLGWHTAFDRGKSFLGFLYFHIDDIVFKE